MTLPALFSGRLRVRLILMVVCAVLPPLAAVLYTAAEWRRHDTVEEQRYAVQLARHAAAIYERLIDESRDMLFSLAQLPVVARGEEPGVGEVLHAFLGQHLNHSNLGVIDPDGKLLVSARPLRHRLEAADRQLFRRAAETRNFVIGDYEIDRADGNAAVTLAYPAVDKAGHVQRVLFAELDLAWVRELVDEAGLPDGTMVTVVDQKGTILAHHPDAATWVGKSASRDPLLQVVLARKHEGTAQGTSLDGIPRLFGFRRLLDSPETAATLYVCVGIPTAPVMARADRILAHNLIGLAVAAALAMAVAWVGGDLFLLRRVRALVNTAKRLSGGDLSARTGLSPESGELGQLAGAFDEMAAALQAREREIFRRNEELVGQDRRFRALIEHSSDGIALLDAEGTVHYAGASITRILGYAIKDVVGHDISEFIHATDRGLVTARLGEALQRPGGFVTATFRARHQNGSWRWIGSVITNLLTEDSVRALVANYRDITDRYEAEESLRQAHEELEFRVEQRTAQLLEANAVLHKEIADRKEAQQALLESEERIRLLLDSAAEGIYGVDLHGNCIFCNPACLRLLGLADAHDLLGANVHAVAHHTRPDGTPYPEDECRIYDAFRHGVSIHVDAEVFWRADGTSFPVEYWSHQMRRGNEVIGSVVTFLDIGDRQRAQAALSDSRAMLAGILGSAPDAIISIDKHQRIILFNAAAERTFQCSEADAIGQPLERFIPERSRDGRGGRFRAFAGAERTGPEQGGQFTLAGRRLDGQEFPAEATISRSDAGGRPIDTIVLRDVTERRRAEERLRTLSRAIDETGDSVFVTDRDGIIQYVNSAFVRLTGYSPAEAIGASSKINKSGEHDRAFYERLWKTILSGQVFRSVFINRMKDGRLYYEDQTIAPIRDGQGRITHFVSTGRDITRRKRTEEALRRLNDQFEHEAARIASVLHDEAGQFLTAAHITLAQVARELESPSRERLHDVRRDLNQIEDQLRRLSHELHPRILDDMGLVGALRFLADGSARRAGIPIHVEASLESRCSPLVETALYRLVQETLTNLTKHAHASQASIVLAQEAQTIHCEVRDDGVGFDATAVLARREATGLGLLGIRDRLEAVGGTLRIVSAPGAGTELYATIPLEADTLISPQEPALPPEV